MFHPRLARPRIPYLGESVRWWGEQRPQEVTGWAKSEQHFDDDIPTIIDTCGCYTFYADGVKITKCSREEANLVILRDRWAVSPKHLTIA